MNRICGCALLLMIVHCSTINRAVGQNYRIAVDGGVAEARGDNFLHHYDGQGSAGFLIQRRISRRIWANAGLRVDRRRIEYSVQSHVSSRVEDSEVVVNIVTPTIGAAYQVNTGTRLSIYPTAGLSLSRFLFRSDLFNRSDESRSQVSDSRTGVGFNLAVRPMLAISDEVALVLSTEYHFARIFDNPDDSGNSAYNSHYHGFRYSGGIAFSF